MTGIDTTQQAARTGLVYTAQNASPTDVQPLETYALQEVPKDAVDVTPQSSSLLKINETAAQATGSPRLRLEDVRLSFDGAIADIRQNLQAMMGKNGIDDDPPFKLKAGTDGSILVDPPDHPDAEAISDMVNADDETANLIRLADNLAHLIEAAKAAHAAQQAAEANPARAEAIYDQLLAVTRQAKNFNFSISVADGTIGPSMAKPDGSIVDLYTNTYTFA